MTTEKLIFLIDTGSQISLIKSTKILEAKINTTKPIEIIGIADNKTLNSLGVTKANLNIGNELISNTFHVMHENMFLRPDGIIGADLLVKFGVVINIPERFILLENTEFSSEAINQIKHLNSFKILDQSPIKNNEFKDYFDAVQNYINYENNIIYTIKSKKQSDPSFYDKLNESFF